MEDEKLFKILGNMIIEFEKQNKKKKIIENRKEMGKFYYAKDFFTKYAKENGGHLECKKYRNLLCCEITYSALVINFQNTDLMRFISSLKLSSCLSLDVNKRDEVVMSISFNNTYKIIG